MAATLKGKIRKDTNSNRLKAEKGNALALTFKTLEQAKEPEEETSYLPPLAVRAGSQQVPRKKPLQQRNHSDIAVTLPR